MFLKQKEHNPPHIHAYYGDDQAKFLISTGELMEGVFPVKAQSMVREFIAIYRSELEEMWESEIYKKLPPLN